MITHVLILVCLGTVTLICGFWPDGEWEALLFTVGLTGIYCVVTLIPTVAIEVRRYNDGGIEWFWILVPIANFVLFFLPTALPKVQNPNVQNQYAYPEMAGNPQPVRFCKNCGAPITGRNNFCINCGTPKE